MTETNITPPEANIILQIINSQSFKGENVELITTIKNKLRDLMVINKEPIPMEELQKAMETGEPLIIK